VDKFVIEGGFPLKGKIKVNGAKNAALPLMAAGLLTEGISRLENVPYLIDILTMAQVLEGLGVKVRRRNRTLEIDSTHLSYYEAPHKLVKLLRASILILGPLLARWGHARICLPGGCNIGRRPVDLHLKGLRQLGAKIEVNNRYIEASVKGSLQGSNIYLNVPSVGATENLMLAATLARGVTLIRNASSSPEVLEVANFLKRAGAKIEGEGTNLIKIEGVRQLTSTHHRIIPDRIEAGTLIMAAIISKGEISLEEICSSHLTSIFVKLREMGAEMEAADHRLRVKGGNLLKSIRVKTLPYPGFSTDLQPQITALACLARGTSVIRETIFENRFTHVPGLRKMGAEIEEEGSQIITKGVPYLKGAMVRAPDIRGGAALTLAGLAAEGRTEIEAIHHLDRGYERLEVKLSKLGAKIIRVEG
jgi:UDP-N-acetylglucosamine 1-carboxyvinyltransferase